MKNFLTTFFGALFTGSSAVAVSSAQGTKTNSIASIIAAISGGLGLVFAKDASNKK